MIRHELDEQGSFSFALDDDPVLRSSTALALQDGWLLVDVVDADGLDEALAGRPVLGVCQLLDRHRRDGPAVAERLGVPLLVPSTLAGRGQPLEIPGVQERAILAAPGWNESALWLPDRRLLVCADALGTAAYFLVHDGDGVGVHPLLRLRPPRGALAGLAPQALAVGHGPPLRGPDVARQVDRALERARRDIPQAWTRMLVLSAQAMRARHR